MRAVTMAFLFLSTSSLRSAAVAEHGEVLIRNARLLDGTGAPPRDGMSLLIRDGRIADVAAEIPAAGAHVVDVAGATVLPGLIDAHVHLAVIPGTLFRADDPAVQAELRRAHLRGYLAAGVTTVLDTAAGVAIVREVREWLNAGHPGPTYLTLGPPIAAPGGYMAAWNPDTTVGSPEQLDAALDLIQSVGVVGVKVPIEYGFGPKPVWPIHSPAMREAIARKAGERGLPIYIHASSEEEQRIGLEMGARVLAHLDFYRAAPSAEFLDLVRSRGAYVITTFSIMDAELTRWSPERLEDSLVELVVPELERRTAADPAAGRWEAATEVGMAEPRLPSFLRGPVAWWFFTENSFREGLASSMRAAKTLHDAGVPLVIGSDAGNWDIIPYQFHASSTHREIELLAETGIPAADVLAATTRVPARMLGMENEIGTIEVGKRADLVVVQGDPLADVRSLRSIRWTVKNGVFHTPEEWMANDSRDLREGP